MSAFFALIVLFALVAMFVGMAKPAWVLPRQSKPTRLKAVGVYFAVMLVGGWLSNATMSEEERATRNARRAAERAERQKARAAQEELEAREREAREVEARKKMAYFMSQEFVKKRLKAPSTAEFPSLVLEESDIRITVQDPNTFTISAYVDAQNAFGAKIRTHYTATLKYLGSDEWQALNVTLE